jgi:hypothetical protein
VTPAAALLAPIRVARLAAAFELSAAEVLADAQVIVAWPGASAALDRWLNARHAWRTDRWRVRGGAPGRPDSAAAHAHDWSPATSMSTLVGRGWVHGS